MIERLRRDFPLARLMPWAMTAAVLLGAAGLGMRASARWLLLLVVALGAVALLWRPTIGLYAIVGTALVLYSEFGTGTEVPLNLATLLTPLVLGVWVVDMVRRRHLRLAPSQINRPAAALLAGGLVSLLIGNTLWDPAVPYPDGFLLSQLAQWAIFAFSVGALWMTGNLIGNLRALRRFTFFFLAVAGCAALVIAVTGGYLIMERGLVTGAFTRAPLWLLLGALAGGQLLFNHELTGGWRTFLVLVVLAVVVYAFSIERATASNWVGIVAMAGVLAWLRWPRLRPVAILLLVVLALTGVLSSSIYDFAGGSAEWEESGGSRLVLTGRVLQVAMHNPITGLGPASYRAYAGTTPLLYMRAYWVNPKISSHNNYVDLFAHGGVLGVGLFVWFAVELTRLGLRLRARFRDGFAGGYVNAMLAAWAGALTLMLFADWILPFVYNIGFPGFQASVLLWMFLGGLPALEQLPAPGQGAEREGAG